MSSTQEVGDIFGSGAGPANAMLRSPTVLIVAVGLWGMNLFFFRLFGINYKFVLMYDLLKDKKKLKDGGGDPSSGTTPTGAAINGKSPPPSGNMSELILGLSEESSLDFELDGVSSIQEMAGTTTTSSKAYASSSLDGDTNKNSATTSGATITWYKLVLFSLILLVMLHSTTRLWMDLLGGGVIGAVLLFYSSVLIYIFIPLSSSQWLRKAFYITLKRTWAILYPRCWFFRHTSPTNIPREVPFVDVFYADAMCSMSKVFFDWGMLLHMMSYYPKPVPQTAYNIIIPSFFAAIPFVIRARQCLLMLYIGKLKNDPKRHHHFANAIKYSTSIWPLLLSAYQKTMRDQVAATALDPFLYLLQTINALYALYWDIVMDWGMMQDPQALVTKTCITTSGLVGVGGGDNSKTNDNANDEGNSNSNGKNRDAMSHRKPNINMHCHRLLLRPRLRFGITMSALIVVSDAVLRFSWLLRFVSSHLFVSHDAFVLCTQFLEVFRRSIWNLLRVEWENIKQKSKALKARDSLSDTEDDEDRPLDPESSSVTEQEMVGLLQTSTHGGGSSTSLPTLGTNGTLS